jgi:hypothetical protein
MADKNITELKADLPAIATKINKSVDTVMRYASMTLYGEIIQGNPVDTGFSRANWNISLNEPNYSVRGARNANASYSPQPAVVPENRQLLPIYIANGVNYVVFLEEGHSKQAPNGFIRIAVERVKAQLDQFLAK